MHTGKSTEEPAPRNKSKAVITIQMRGGSAVVRKDYSHVRNPLLRLYGRITLRNEERAYRRLQGLAGVPVCYGLSEDACRLDMSFVPGKRLALFKRRSVPAETFALLEHILRGMHGRGVANMDLHRSNVLIDDDGGVHIIDFAHAIVSRDPLRPGLVARFAMRLDRHAFERMRAHFVGLKKTMPTGAFGVVYRAMRGAKHLLRQVKKSKRGR